jgi:sugar lactone lactonase YvrE
MSETILVEGLVFLEGPRWHDGRLYFSDMHAQRVMTVDESGKLETIVKVPGRPSGLGWDPQGRLLIVSMTDRRLLRLDGAELSEVADLSGLVSFPCNDMVVDAQGRAYIGNFGFDFEAGDTPCGTDLILVAPDGATRVVASDLEFPNGSVITPDGGTLIVGESLGRRYTAFDIESDGSLTNRRVWAELGKATPDGCCIDAECGIWAASPGTREVLRVLEGGEVTQRIPTQQQAIACMLGGADRRTLFILSAGSVAREECQRNRDARIITTRVEIPGAGWP